jgi:Ca2+-binding RTX toxin-like protein
MSMRVPLAVAATLVGAILVIPSSASASASAPGIVLCEGHRATIVGTHRNDVIVGTSHADVIAALDGNDVVHGEGGNDIICGNDGADRLYGGSGNDQLYGGRSDVFVGEDGFEADADVLDGGSGNDRLIAGFDPRGSDEPSCQCFPDELTWHSSAHGVHINIGAGTADGDGHDTFDGQHVAVIGSPYADVIDGSPGPDLIFSGDGSDLVRSGDGDDSIETDLFLRAGPHGGADRVWAGPGNDHVVSGAGPDIVHGGLGNDVITDQGTPDSADQLFGDAGDDEIVDALISTSAPQRLSGGTGLDLLNPGLAGRHRSGDSASWNMGTGAMTFHPFGGAVVHVMADGFENANLGGWKFAVRGTDGPNTILTNSNFAGSSTYFTALGGDDTFQGSIGDDTFDGGPGTDHSLGMGDGDDTCISVEVLDKPDCEHIIS